MQQQALESAAVRFSLEGPLCDQARQESPNHEIIGMWLSLVERCVRDAEAAGSNPVNPTRELKGCNFQGASLFCIVCATLTALEWAGRAAVAARKTSLEECMKILGMGMPELLIILAVILLIFGPKNLPKLGASLGKTVKSLREGMAFDKDKDEEVEEIVEIVEDEPEVAYATAGESETKVVKKVVRKKAE